METHQSSEQELNQYKEKIISLYRILKHDFREYSDRKNRQFNFTSQQLHIIDVLNRNPGMNLHELSEQLRTAKSNVSVIVERLVCKGVVAREIPGENRRIVKLTLSPEFAERYNSLKYLNQYWADIFRDATVEELETIIKGLEKYHELFEKGKSKITDEINEKSDGNLSGDVRYHK